MITVCLHGGLREYGRRFDLHAANPAEAVRALLTQLPGFREILGSGFYQVRFNGHDFCEAELEHEFRQPESGILHIVPRIQGAGKAGRGADCVRLVESVRLGGGWGVDERRCGFGGGRDCADAGAAA